MHSLLNLVSVIASSIVLSIVFQNCSPTGFDEMNQLSTKMDSVQPDSIPTVNDSDEEIIEKCELLKDSRREISELPSDGNLINLKGSSIVKADTIRQIKNANGNIIIFADSANAQIDLIEESQGNIIICGFNVNLVQNHVRGNLVIVGGNVNMLKDFNGNLRLIGGQVTGQIFKSNGSLTVSKFNY